MTKIKLSIIGLFVLFLSITTFFSCSKDENTQNPTSTNNENILLKKAYDFENISFKNDVSNNSMFNSSKNLDKLNSKKSSKNQNFDLDLKNVTQINWKNQKVSYLIPFKNNPKKSVVITIKISSIGKPLNFSKAKIVENLVNSENGNGQIIITNIEGSTEKTFANGVLKNKGKSNERSFRSCFDDAYNSICDGFIGCASWYSSPLPALTSIAYCGAVG